MVWLDKKTGKTSVKKPNVSTSKPQTPTVKPSSAKPASYKENLKFLRDAFARQQAKGMAAQTVPGAGQLLSALLTGASLGEAYKQTNRAPAVSGRGAGRATFNPQKPPKAKTPQLPKAAAPVIPVSKTEPETPAPDTRLDPAPAPAKEVVPAPSQRSLKIKEARTKYKDSPFKQWAHANQALAKALKPGQVGYEQVQEYFREQTKTKMGRGANDLSGYSSTIA